MLSQATTKGRQGREKVKLAGGPTRRAAPISLRPTPNACSRFLFLICQTNTHAGPSPRSETSRSVIPGRHTVDMDPEHGASSYLYLGPDP